MVTDQADALAVEGLDNLRDLGGLPIVGGGTTRYGRLLRSDSPHRLSDAGRRTLVAQGISTVVDLRTLSERDSHPSLLVDVEGIRGHHAPIFDDEDVFPEDAVTAQDVYRWWLRERGTGIAAALTGIADSPSAPILVHCHAGKDRTGVVIALVLVLAGVPVDSIADDYALSGVQLAEVLARDRVSAVERGMDDVRAERLFTVRRDAMVDTVESIESEHGGPTQFLRRVGLEDQRIDRLRRLLVAAEWP